MSADRPLPDTLPPLGGAALVVLTLGLALGSFIEVLDSTIANVAVPTLAGSYGVTASQGTWVISAYATTAAIGVPITGWLSRRVGEVRVFTGAVALFTLVSALCGMAPSLESLVVLRLLQGLASGPLMPLSQVILMRSFPENRRGLALALWGITVIVAPILGPVIGGWIIDHYSWPWIFYINIPTGLFSFAACTVLLRGRESARTHTPIDFASLAMLVLGVGALQMLLDLGREHDWFASDFIVALAIIAFVMLGFLIIRELHSANPIVDLRLLRDRNFLIGALLTAAAMMTFSTVAVVLPLWLQTVMGYSAFQAGLALMPASLAALVLMPLVGANLNRFGLRTLSSAGFVFFSLALWLGSQYTLEASFSEIIRPGIGQGIGLAFFFVPLMSLALSRTPDDRLASASSLLNFLRTLSAAFGTAVSITIWDRRATLHHAGLSEWISPYLPAASQFMGRLQALGMSRTVELARIDQLVAQRAYMLATNDIFYMSCVVFAVLAMLVWVTRPGLAKAGAGLH